MHNFDTHIGVLKTDALGLYVTLCQVFTKSEVTELEEIYQRAWTAGAGEEAPVRREPGVSYNPKPARLAAILLKEVKPIAFSEVASAFWMAREPLDTATQSASSRSGQLSQCCYESQAAMAFNQLTEDAEGSPSIYKLQGALLLDKLRHLHMSEISREQIQVIINLTQRYLSRIASTPQLARIATLISHAARRYAA